MKKLFVTSLTLVAAFSQVALAKPFEIKEPKEAKAPEEKKEKEAKPAGDPAPVIVKCSDSLTVGNILGGGTDPYDDCEGPISGNLNGNPDELTEIAGFFGGAVADWTYQGKSDDGSNGPFTSDPDATSGTVTFDSPITSTFVIGIKGGPDYSYYLFNANALGIESIDFDTLGITKGSGGAGPDSSHFALYTQRTTSTPVSDTGSMLAMVGAGLLGLGLLRRRLT